MEQKLYPISPTRAVIAGPSATGKTFFLTKLILKIIIENDEIYIFSPSLHHDTYQNIIECFENHIPLKSINKV